uniref:Retrotransposon protein, putative, Ty3-gypsy sub-class n=2 Tax=Oryza sativa subsp. japonica TaxID=39947 RepID=Q2R613_ORYSJ|nr:retrotransposon protein, putative, Ty3-gypsy sub-class [Oryza sativa Japonica Group]ABA92977.1 retrotransposon protein, putative, Ty3-gypsy subclass [Oryza sativa Japonica Group]
MTGMGGAQNQRYQQGNNNRVPDDPCAKVMFKIPSFSGYYDAEKYFDWEMIVEQKFSTHLVPEQHRVRQATCEAIIKVAQAYLFLGVSTKEQATGYIWSLYSAETTFPTTRRFRIQCHRYHGFGHVQKVCPSQLVYVATDDDYISTSDVEDDEEEEKKDKEQKDLSIAPCMLEECLIDQAPVISEDEKKGNDNGATTTQDVEIDKDKFNTLHDKMKPRTVSNQEGEDNEDTTSSDITMTILYINQPKVSFLQKYLKSA